MRFVIITGMSGAGKSSVLKMLEDTGFFCVDNLPISLVPKLAQLSFGDARSLEKVALGIDIRSGDALVELEFILDKMKEDGKQYEILFLDAVPAVLVKRYKETRRTHPLAGVGRVEDGIEEEGKALQFLKKRADYYIDTSHLLIRGLKSEIDKIFRENKKGQHFFVTILSFGFKYGIPTDSDLVFDVRFLPNPYYITELKEKNGNDKEVFEYVMKAKEATLFLNKLEELLEFLIPNYMIEGKNQLVVSIGCTGGRHRSVTLANALKQRLEHQKIGIAIEHRDVLKG